MDKHTRRPEIIWPPTRTLGRLGLSERIALKNGKLRQDSQTCPDFTLVHGSHLQAWKPEHGHIPPGVHPLDVDLPLWLEALDGVVEHEHVASEGRRFPVEFDPFCTDATKAETFRVQVLQRRVPYAAKIHRLLLDTLILLSIFVFLAIFFLGISAALKDLIAILTQQSTFSLEESAVRQPDVDGDDEEKTSPVICEHAYFYAATFPESVSKMSGEKNITMILCKNLSFISEPLSDTRIFIETDTETFCLRPTFLRLRLRLFFDTKIIETDTNTLKRKEIILDTDTTFPNFYGES